MKLRKAIDKAVLDTSEPVLRYKESQSQRFQMKEEDSQSPVYSTSRVIPYNPKTAAGNRCIEGQPESITTECYKVLRAKIQHHLKSNNWRTILVTSPQPGDGKTLTAVNLALVFAKAYSQTVLLVDCDLRRQDVHKTLGIDSRSGLKDYLIHQTPLEKTIIWPAIEKFCLISGGESLSNSAEILSSPRMHALIEEMKQRYEDRVVFLDTPPLLGSADTLALMPWVDCIIMVVCEGKTSMGDVKKALNLIPTEKLLGFVLNRQRNGTIKAYYHH